MQKWEYLTVDLDEYGNVRAASGQAVGKKVVGLQNFLTQLGENGWEMVGSIATGPRGNVSPQHYLFFKRPKP